MKTEIAWEKPFCKESLASPNLAPPEENKLRKHERDTERERERESERARERERARQRDSETARERARAGERWIGYIDRLE